MYKKTNIERKMCDGLCCVKLPSRILRKLPHPNIDKMNHAHFMFLMDAE